jgi:hypothetical protein
MCINDYETKIEDQGPVRAVELLGKKKLLLFSEQKSKPIVVLIKERRISAGYIFFYFIPTLFSFTFAPCRFIYFTSVLSLLYSYASSRLTLLFYFYLRRVPAVFLSLLSAIVSCWFAHRSKPGHPSLQTLQNHLPPSVYFSTLKMEAALSYDTSVVIYQNNATISQKTAFVTLLCPET